MQMADSSAKPKKAPKKSAEEMIVPAKKRGRPEDKDERTEKTKTKEKVFQGETGDVQRLVLPMVYTDQE